MSTGCSAVSAPEPPTPPRRALRARLSLCVAGWVANPYLAGCWLLGGLLAGLSRLLLGGLGLPLLGRGLDLRDALRELTDDDVTPPDLLVPGGHDLAQVGHLIAQTLH